LTATHNLSSGLPLRVEKKKKEKINSVLKLSWKCHPGSDRDFISLEKI
jgi:hypothetical protein